MPIHDWSRVPAGLFHDFHQSWVVEIANVLNRGILSDGFCALIDVPDPPPNVPESEESYYARKGNRISIRRGLTHVVSILHVTSPGDKRERRDKSINTLAEFVRAGVHVLIVDLFPPAELLPGILPGQVTEPSGKGRTLASYRCGEPPVVLVEPVAVGDVKPDMPLFITKDAHVPVPLEETYLSNWKATGKPLRDLLEA